MLLAFLLTLLIGLPTARAQDEEDDGGAVLSPELQWRLADGAWHRREYDDAAALMGTYAAVNPDQPQTIEAWWRTYEIYRAYRPNEDRRKTTFTKAVEA